MTPKTEPENPPAGLPETLPVLPLRDTVPLPFAVIPLAVGQERPVRLGDGALRSNRLIALVSQQKPDRVPAGPDDIHRVGTAAMVHQLSRSADGTLRLIVQCLDRIRLLDFVQTEPYLAARIERAPEIEGEGNEVEGLVHAARDLFRKLAGLIPERYGEITLAVEALSDPHQIISLISTRGPFSIPARQEILEIDSITAKLRKLIGHLQHELTVRELGQKITEETQEEMSKAQRDYFLREQLKTIQRELGEESPERKEIETLRRRLKEIPLPEEARKEAERELGRLEQLPPAAAEHGLILTYLDWLLNLPWGATTGGRIDVAHARSVLD